MEPDPRACVGVEQRSHLPEAAIQAGLGRTQRDPERRGDIRQRQVEEMMQNDDRPLVGLEAVEPGSSSSRSAIDDVESPIEGSLVRSPMATSNR